MQVTVDGWAWLPKADLSTIQVQTIRHALTLKRKKVGDHPGDDPEPIYLYSNTADYLGVPRQYFFEKRKAGTSEVNLQVTEGNKAWWPGDAGLTLNPEVTLRAEQQAALSKVSGLFRGGTLGGIVRAVPGWGKTVLACSLIAELKVPTLVVVHKEFLVNQWRKRILGDLDDGIKPLLPGAKVGIVQQDLCEYRGMHIAIAMVHSLSGKDYPAEFYNWPGLVITDEVHRIGAETWSLVPPRFPAKWRLGLSATPRRRDGADGVFLHHIGPVMFAAKEQRLKPKVRKVWSEFHIVKTGNLNPGLIKKSMVVNFLCMNPSRNRLIVEQIRLAVKAGRKCLVVSARLAHLGTMEKLLQEMWRAEDGAPPSMGYYIGGKDEDELKFAESCRVVFATEQLVTEGLDIPPLDTLFLTTPMADVEQVAGRILRPWEGKKDPIIVDFRDEKVSLCKRFGELRDKFYARIVDNSVAN
jgi:superfamily II DNA or RNA helicase